MQTADWQLLFSDRFTGARNPARLSTTDAIPSNPLRPLSVSFYHQEWVNPAKGPAFDSPVAFEITKTMTRTTVAPQIGTTTQEKLVPLYHVVLLNDEEHTYDYVIEMLGAIFMLTPSEAFHRAVEVDTTGRTIVMTCELEQAQFGRDQIHAYGADPRMPASKGSMSATVEPADPV